MASVTQGLWFPETYEQIEEAASTFDESTATFEAKKEFPKVAKFNEKIARTITAMSVNGGLLLFGLDEDKRGRPCILNPIPLSGLEERVQSIVLSSISEPPFIKAREYRKSDGDHDGLLGVLIPPSPRAPHMVIVKDDNRYYTRKGSQNVKLNQREVEALYRERLEAEASVGDLLEDLVNDEPLRIAASRGQGSLFLIAKPLSPRGARSLDDDFERPQDRTRFLMECHQSANEGHRSPCAAPPWLIDWNDKWTGGAGGCKIDTLDFATRTGDASMAFRLVVEWDGTISLFWGGLVGMAEQTRYLSLSDLFGIVSHFAFFSRALFSGLGYFGEVGFGLAMEGVQGARLVTMPTRHARSEEYLLKMGLPGSSTCDVPRPRRVLRLSAPELDDDPLKLARKLLRRFFHEQAGDIQYRSFRMELLDEPE